MTAPASSPATAAEPRPLTAEEKERHWFEHVYAGDDVPQLTIRAVLMGTVIGCVMAFSNLYVGLKAGWGLNVAITACIISYTVFRLFHAIFPGRGARNRRKLLWLFDRPDPGQVSILENNCMQSTASSAGYSTGVDAGLRLPRLPPDHRPNVPFWTMAGLVLGTRPAGRVPGHPHEAAHDQRRAAALPVGIAAAETLRSLHGAGADARMKARGLFTAMGLGAALGFVPGRRARAGLDHLPRQALHHHPELLPDLRALPQAGVEPARAPHRSRRLHPDRRDLDHLRRRRAPSWASAAPRPWGWARSSTTGSSRPGCTSWASSRSSATAASWPGRSGAAHPS